MKTEKQIEETNEQRQIANNNQVDDYIISNGAIKEDFVKKILEYKYLLPNKKSIAELIANKAKLKKDIDDIRKNLHFEKIVCAFDFSKYEPNEAEQEMLIEFQKDIFDEITVQVINPNTDLFNKLCQKANVKGRKFSIRIDTIHSAEIITELFEQFNYTKPENIRFKYRKLSNNLDKYEHLKNICLKYGLKFYFVDCTKRLSIDQYKELDTSSFLKAFLGCNGCSIKYYPNRLPPGSKRFVPKNEMYQFNSSTWEWNNAPNKAYRISRDKDYRALDKVQGTSSQVKLRPKVQKLIENLRRF